MAHISGFERSNSCFCQRPLTTTSVLTIRFDSSTPFVDGLDLSSAGFLRVAPKATGRPGYAPGDFLKLYIYGYLNRVQSSRRLEAECRRNIEVIWLLRTQKPGLQDHRGLPARRSLCLQIGVSSIRPFWCRRLDLFGRELLAADDTRIKAVNNKDRNFTR
jgi:transposase